MQLICLESPLSPAVVTTPDQARELQQRGTKRRCPDEAGARAAKRRRVGDAVFSARAIAEGTLLHAMECWAQGVLGLMCRVMRQVFLGFDVAIDNVQMAARIGYGIATELKLWSKGFDRPDAFVALWIGLKFACQHRPCATCMVLFLRRFNVNTTVQELGCLELDMLFALDWNLLRFLQF